MPRALAPIAVVALLLAACNRPRWDTPVDAYLSFARAVQKGEFDVAYGGLSEATRGAMAARAKEISQASGGAVRDDPVALFFVEAARAPQVTEVKLAKLEGTAAVVSASADGQSQQVRMVREQGGWHLDVPEVTGH